MILRRVLTLLVLLCPAAGFSEPRFSSPKGTTEVRFEIQEKRYYANPSARPLPPEARQQLYRVSFYAPKTTTAIAVAYFTDIQMDPQGEFPAKIDVLARGITWSPEEDFCLLPLEQWPENPKQPVYRQAVAIRNSNTGQTTNFILADSPLVWITPTKVAGHARTECRDYVSVFDGRTGRSEPIESGDATGGYQILQADANQILMQRVPPLCGPEAGKPIPKSCEIYDLRFQRRQMASCP